MDVRTVLVIDADRDVADVVRAMLEDEGYRVAVLARVSSDAIAATVGRLEPDAILLDGESEAGYGGSWDEAARLAQRARRIPVIMFSAHAADVAEAREARTERSTRAKFSAVIAKPFDIDDLLATVAAAVGVAAPFDGSAEADARRSSSLARELERAGARDVRASARREWVTFRTPRDRVVQVYWWQTGGSYLVGRYDADGRQLENMALTYDRDSAIEICASLIRLEQAQGAPGEVSGL